MEENHNQQRERHPSRASRVDYTEPEVPDDDHYLFDNEGENLNHGDSHIPDTLIPVELEGSKLFDNTANETKARSSIPKGLQIKTSSINNARLGVFAKDKFKPGTRFGPYEGEKIHLDFARDGRDTSYMWEIMKDGDVCYCINGKDEGIGNWLRFVNCARTETEQNLVAYQYHNEIYYRVCKHVSVGDELLVWYCEKYGKDLEIQDSTDSQKDIINNAWQGQINQCCICMQYFDYSFLSSHVKWCEGRNSNSEKGKPRIYILAQHSEDRKSETIFNDTDYNRVEKSFGCEICGKQFNTSSELARHKIIHTGEKRFGCEICGKQFSRSSDLTRHKRIHTGEKPFRCEICGNKFNRSRNLTRHKRIHSGEKPFGCEICGNRFSDSSNLNQHKIIHSGEKPFGCEICEKKFSDPRNLTRHKQIHSGEKPFGCETCGKKFSKSSDLTKHKRVHTGEKPFECEICGKKFCQSGSLTAHRRIHTGEKPFGCEICGKRFCQLTTVITHKRIHSREKPFGCETCGKRFSSSSDLTKHKRTHKRSS